MTRTASLVFAVGSLVLVAAAGGASPGKGRHVFHHEGEVVGLEPPPSLSFRLTRSPAGSFRVEEVAIRRLPLHCSNRLTKVINGASKRDASIKVDADDRFRGPIETFDDSERSHAVIAGHIRQQGRRASGHLEIEEWFRNADGERFYCDAFQPPWKTRARDASRG